MNRARLILSLAIVFFSITSIALAEDFSQVCGTDFDYSNDVFSDLLQRKMNNKSGDQITLFQTSFWSSTGEMPSTGNVKALVLPISFRDNKLPDTIVDDLNKLFFYQANDELLNSTFQANDMSVSDYYKKASFNKLNITGKVLPVYFAENDWEYYFPKKENGAYDLTPIENEIVIALQSYRNIIGDISQYDANNDGYIDCLYIYCYRAAAHGTKVSGGFVANSSHKEIYDGIKMGQSARISASEYNSTLSSTAIHETSNMFMAVV